MTEKKYAQLLDSILEKLSSDTNNEVHQVELSKTLDVRPTFLMGLLTELKEKDLIEILPITGGKSAKIKPRGLVFLESGGFTTEWRDKWYQRGIAFSSTFAAIASAVAAVALFFLTREQSNQANSNEQVNQKKIEVIEANHQALEKKIDSLATLLQILSTQKSDTVTIQRDK